MDPTERELIANVTEHPADSGARAVLEDYLLERERPEARFIALDREIASLQRSDPEFRALAVELDKVAAAIDPAWLVAVGELDGQRYDLYEERQLFERGLRRAECEALAARRGDCWLATNPAISALARIGRLLPRPHVWRVRQPPYNQSWGERAEHADVVLRDCGPSKIQAIKEIRRFTGLGLADAKRIADNGGVVDRDVPYHHAREMIEAFAAVGARAGMVGGARPAGDFDSLHGGGLTVRVTGDQHLEVDGRPAMPIAEIPGRGGELASLLRDRG